VAETRPNLEGSRVAAWELHEAGVSYAVLTDAAAAGLVAGGEVDAVVVGADRVTAGGDVVATAGTYPLALAAHAAAVPFLVGVPLITIDLATAEGRDAPIEEPRPARVLAAAGTRVAPEGSKVRSPAQDLTPSTLVTAIVTEAGVVRAPLGPGLAAQVAS
jgi:methylthioribose-1-phosphate isomerase